MHAMNYGKVEEPSSSRRRFPSTARFAATSAILTVISSRSDRAPISSTVNARLGCLSELEPSMSSVPIDQRSYELHPRAGFIVTYFITVADIDRSADFYEKVF